MSGVFQSSLKSVIQEIEGGLRSEFEYKTEELRVANSIHLHASHVRKLVLTQCRESAKNVFTVSIQRPLDGLLANIMSTETSVLVDYLDKIIPHLHDGCGYGSQENADSIVEYSGLHAKVLILVQFLRYNSVVDETVKENFFVNELCVEYVLKKLFKGAFLEETFIN
jgi:hypothetical protein